MTVDSWLWHSNLKKPMHRFLTFAPVKNARVALRSDASIWLIADEGARLSLNRGSGWVDAHRLRLCAGDRIRTGETGLSLAELLEALGVDAAQAGAGARSERDVPGSTTPVPLVAPAELINQARRNPGTGQIEPGSKE